MKSSTEKRLELEQAHTDLTQNGLEVLAKMRAFMLMCCDEAEQAHPLPERIRLRKAEPNGDMVLYEQGRDKVTAMTFTSEYRHVRIRLQEFQQDGVDMEGKESFKPAGDAQEFELLGIDYPSP